MTPRILGDKIPDVWKIVTDRMRELGLTPYSVAKLAQQAGGKLTEQTVRNFMAGTHDMTSKKFAAVLSALRLEIRPKN